MIVAEYEERDPQLSLTNLLVYGYRGYISYSENDLCKMFDKIFFKELEKANERKIALLKRLKDQPSWAIDYDKGNIIAIEQVIARFQELADEIFEDKVLL